jgi:hypothetical protein
MRSSSRTSNLSLPFNRSSCDSPDSSALKSQLLTFGNSESFRGLAGVGGGLAGEAADSALADVPALAGVFSVNKLMPSVIVDSSIGFPK